MTSNETETLVGLVMGVLDKHSPEGRSYGTRCGGCYPAEGSTFYADPEDPEDGWDGPVRAYYRHVASCVAAAIEAHYAEKRPR